jgi:hypothetical protein
LFNALEKYCKLKSSKEEMKKGDLFYISVRSEALKLVDQFQDHESTNYQETKRISSFFILDFIEDNYGLEILELESGNFLKEKIHFM